MSEYAMMDWTQEVTPADKLKLAKKRKNSQLSAEHRLFTSGSVMTSLGFPMQFGTTDSLMVDGAIKLAQATGQESIYLTDANDVTHEGISLEQAQAVLVEMAAAFAQAHRKKQTLRHMVSLAQSQADLDEIVWQRGGRIMAQYAYPISDVENSGSWVPSTGTDLYACLDETTPNGISDEISRGGTPGGFTYTAGLGSLSDPASSSGHILNVHYKIEAGGTAFSVDLYQGSTLIKANTTGSYPSYETLQFTLSSSEADAITDYTALRVKVTSSNSKKKCFVSWLRFDVPDAITTYTGSAAIAAASSVSAAQTVSTLLFGSGTAASVSAISASVTLCVTGNAAMASVSSISAAQTAYQILTGSAAVACASSLSAEGVTAVHGSAAIAAASGGTASGTLAGEALTGSASMSAASGMTASWTVQIHGAAAAASSSAVSVSGTLLAVVSGECSMAAESAVSAVPMVSSFGSCAASASSAISAVPTVEGELFGTGTITAVSAIGAEGVMVWLIGVEFGASSSLSACGYSEVPRAAEISCASSLSAEGILLFSGSGNISSSSSLTADAMVEAMCSCVMPVVSSMGADGALAFSGAAVMESSSEISVRIRVSGHRYVTARITMDGELKILGSIITGGHCVRFHRNGDLSVLGYLDDPSITYVYAVDGGDPESTATDVQDGGTPVSQSADCLAGGDPLTLGEPIMSPGIVTGADCFRIDRDNILHVRSISEGVELVG